MSEKYDVLPKEFIERIKLLFDENEQKIVLESFCTRRPHTFRVNTLKSNAVDLFNELTNLGFELERVKWDSNAFVLRSKLLRELSETSAYKEGRLYVQNLSSMIPPVVLDPKEGDLVLDSTAAPGSKTTQMAALMNNTGQIIANDRSRVRNFVLKHNLNTLGVTNTVILTGEAQLLWRRYPEIFDKVLCDVPCSLEGRFFVESEKSYSNWSMARVKKLSDYQKMILHSSFTCLKPGCELIYSTCTFSPEENEAVVDWLLNKERGRAQVVGIALPKEVTHKNGLTSWDGKSFDKSLSETVRIVPGELLEGFYLAKIVKKV